MAEWKDQLAQRWAIINKARLAGESATTPKHVLVPPFRRKLEINLGVDFGTAFTKVCYRIVGREIVGLVPFGIPAEDGEPTMLPSKVWIDTTGRLFSPFDSPPRDAQEVQYFKMHLAGRGIGDPIRTSLRTNKPIYRLITAYYLSRVLKKVMGVIPELERSVSGGAEISWSGNIGIPIGYLESEAKPRFEEVVRAAVEICNRDSIADTPTLHEFEVAYLEAIASVSSKHDDFFLTSELEAEITGLVSDPSTKDGIYALFDVGGGTLDGAVFSLKRVLGEPRVNFLTALVAPLGCEAAASAALLSVSTMSVALAMRKGETTLRLDTEELKKDIHRHVSSVVVIARRKSELSWKELMPELPVFLCGGGRHSKWHTESIKETYQCNQHKSVGIPRYLCRELDAPTSREMKYNGAKDFGRYLVAYGLSIPKGTFPEPIGFPRHNPEVEYRKFDTDSVLEMRMYELYSEIL
jgi:hypothetical protein